METKNTGNQGSIQTPAESEREMQGQMMAAVIIALAAGIGFVAGMLVLAWVFGLF